MIQQLNAVLALPRQMYEYLRDRPRALEYLQSAGLEKNEGKKYCFSTETHDHC